MTKQLILVAGLALACLCAPVFAAGNGFVRVEGGRSDVDLSADGIGSGSDEDSTWGVRGGYWFITTSRSKVFTASFTAPPQAMASMITI